MSEDLRSAFDALTQARPRPAALCVALLLGAAAALPAVSADVRKPYRWDRGRKLTAAEVRAAVERAIARSDKR